MARSGKRTASRTAVRSLLAIQSGGVAYLGVAFGEYLSVFIPWFSSSHLLASVAIGSWRFEPNGAQLAGVAAVLGLSAVNYVGVSQGARTQGMLTAAKVLALGGLIVVGLVLPARVAPQWTAPLPSAGLPAGVALALLAVFGNFDGWYQATMSAGEVRRPARDLPLGMIGGTLGMTALYLLSNWVYLRALPISAIGASPRVGEEAAAALLGPTGGRIMSGLVLISIFGCISSSLVGASRVALPMAQDRLFFQSFARVHPRFRTPTTSVVFMALWSCGLVLTGSYGQIFTYAVLSALLFHAATGAAVWRLRRIAPDAPRPYRVPGYPWVPAIFVLSTLAVVANGLIDRPRESLLGLSVLVVGVPAYHWLRRIGVSRARAAGSE